MQAQLEKRSDRGHWASSVYRLEAPQVGASEAINLNVSGRRPTGVVQGFGQLWQKTYRVSLPADTVSEHELIRVWKERFESFWPAGNRFFIPLRDIQPGEVALINLHPLPGPLKLSTGVVVIYADDESFSFMTPEGHMFASWITFSASRASDAVVAQVEMLLRTSDPAWELVMRAFGGYRQEDRFWEATLRRLASHFGAEDPRVEIHRECLDPRLQWSKVWNIWRNAGFWSGVYWCSTPLRLLGRLARP